MEAAGLGIFMISAGFFTTLLEYPDSPIRQLIGDPFMRRVVLGLAMGVTAVAIIDSPWGKQSGAHINPAVTLSFFRLGKIKTWDALFYIVAQFMGGVAGVVLIAAVIGQPIANAHVNYVVTIPGNAGIGVAFLSELMMSYGLMIAILIFTNRENLHSYTGLLAGSLVAIYIIFEAPFSGMSINPARSFGSALPARLWTGFWIYIIAPPAGMLLAAETYIRVKGTRNVMCAKLHHHNDKRCIFNCGYKEFPEDNI